MNLASLKRVFWPLATGDMPTPHTTVFAAKANHPAGAGSTQISALGMTFSPGVLQAFSPPCRKGISTGGENVAVSGLCVAQTNPRRGRARPWAYPMASEGRHGYH